MKNIYPQLHFLTIISFLICCNSCKSTTNEKTHEVEPVPIQAQPVYFEGEQFIPLDYSINEYKIIESATRSVLLESGWLIQYLVKEDSTQYQDIYIHWSKDKKEGLTWASSDFSALPSYFIPYDAKESETHIFLQFGKYGVLVLSKDDNPKANSFPYYIEYDVNLGQVVYIPERSYSLDILEIDVIDLNRNLKKTLSFENKCDLSPESSCIDSIDFNKDYIRLFATFNTWKDHSNIVKEVKTMTF